MFMFYLHVCMHTMYVPGAHRGQKKAPDPSRSGVTNGCELPHDAGNQICVLYKNSHS